MPRMKPLTLFKCLSDDTRLSLVLLLKARGQLCVCDLMNALQVSQPKVSRHLAPLRECGLLQSEKRGQWVYYRLHPQLEDWVTEVIDNALLASRQRIDQLSEALTGACCD